MANRQSTVEKMVTSAWSSHVKKWLKNIIGFSVTIVFVYILSQRIDLQSVIKSFSSVPLHLLSLAVLALTAGYLTRTVRWWYMLNSITNQIKWTQCVSPFVISMAVNNLLPLRAGDVMRIFAFRNTNSITYPQVLGTLVLERILDLMTVLLLFFLTLYATSITVIPADILKVVKLILFVSLILITFILMLPAFFRRILIKLQNTKLINQYQWLPKLFMHCQGFLDAIQLVHSPRRLLMLVLLSLGAWLFEGTVYLIAAHALNYNGSLFGPYCTASIGALSTLMPSSPGYIGTFDYFTMMALEAFKAPAVMAASFAILVHLILWLPVNIAGLIFYLNSTMPWAKVKRFNHG